MQRRRHSTGRDGRYLTALIGWGYKPSDVERLILVTAASNPERVEDGQPEQVEEGQPEQVEVAS